MGECVCGSAYSDASGQFITLNEPTKHNSKANHLTTRKMN